MEDLINEQYMENKLEMVEVACEAGDYETAEAIIGDVESEGMPSAELKQVVLDTPIFNFIANWAAKN